MSTAPQSTGSRTRTRLDRARRSQVGAIVTTGLFIQGLNVLSGPLVARMLGPSGRGAQTMVMVVATMGAQLGTAALCVAIAHTVAKHHEPARDLLRNGLPRWLLWCLLPSLGAGIAVFFALRSSHNHLVLAVLASAISMAGCSLNLFIAMLRGELAVAKVVRVPTVQVILYVALVACFFVLHPLHDAAEILALSLFTLCFAVGLAWFGLRKPIGAPALENLKPVHSFARSAYVSSIGAIDALGLDYVLIGLLLNDTSLGLYAVAGSVATLPAMALGGVASMLVPRMAAAGEHHGHTVMKRWMGAALLIDLAIVAVLMVVVGPAIRILFGHAFEGSIPCAHILIATWGLLTMRRLLTAVIQAQGRGRVASRIEFVAALAMLAAIPFGVRVDGIVGAAGTYFAVALASCLALALVVRWRPPLSTEGVLT